MPLVRFPFTSAFPFPGAPTDDEALQSSIYAVKSEPSSATKSGAKVMLVPARNTTCVPSAIVIAPVVAKVLLALTVSISDGLYESVKFSGQGSPMPEMAIVLVPLPALETTVTFPL